MTQLNICAVKYYHLPLTPVRISYNPIRHNVYINIPYPDEIREHAYFVLSP